MTDPRRRGRKLHVPERALVGNAADPGQVREATKKEKLTRASELDDLFELLKDPRFRRFAWRMLTYCRVYESIFEQSSKIYHNSGRQDVGHFLVAEITQADEEAYFTMLREHMIRRINAAEPDPTPTEE
jgi:hypothetical protein